MDGAGKVFAVVEDFSADVKKAVAEKKLRYISVEFWERDRRGEGNEPPYLKAVALLGRDMPAVQGAKLPACFSQGVMSVLDEKEFITAFPRKVDAEDKAAFSGTGGAENQGSTELGNHEEVKRMDELEKMKAQYERLSGELAAANERIAAFEKENGELKNAERKTEAATFFAKLRDEGKMPPALFEKAVELDAKMTEEGRKEYRALFSALEAKVDLSGNHAAPKGKVPAADVANANLTAKIRAFQKEKGFSTFSEAADAFYTANPGAFDEGGAE
jgi:hypothetical protein